MGGFGGDSEPGREEQRGCVWTLPHGGPRLGGSRGTHIKQERSAWRFTSGSLPPSPSVDVFSTGGSHCHVTDWAKPAHRGHLSLGAELPCTGLRNKGMRRGKAGSRSSGGRSRPDSEGGGMHSIQAGPPGPHVWGSGPPREGDRGTGLFVYKPSPSSPRFCFPFKPWCGFSTVEVLGGELACWDPSTHRSFPWPALLLEAGPAGAGVGDRGQTPSPSSRPTDPRAPRTVAWEPQGHVVSRHHCAQT